MVPTGSHRFPLIPTISHRFPLLPQVIEAVILLSPPAAIERDASWRVAARALCSLSARPEEGSEAASRSAVDSVAIARLAAPLLVSVFSALLQEWTASASNLGTLLSARATQLLHALNLASSLTIPEDVLSPAERSPSAGGMVRAPSYLSAVSAAGPRGHLVRLAPSLIGSIGQPPMTGSSAPLPHECIELQLSVRGCLLQLAEELGLTG